MLTIPSFKKSLIVEQFQGNYLKVFEKFAKNENTAFASLNMHKISGKLTNFSVFAFNQLTKLEHGINLA